MRAGKSTILQEFKEYLLKNEVDKKNIIFITLDYDTNNYNGIKQISAMDFLLDRVEL